MQRHTVEHIEIFIFSWQQAEHGFASPFIEMKLLHLVCPNSRPEGGKYNLSGEG
jgi:hypothetical protein